MLQLRAKRDMFLRIVLNRRNARTAERRAMLKYPHKKQLQKGNLLGRLERMAKQNRNPGSQDRVGENDQKRIFTEVF